MVPGGEVGAFGHAVAAEEVDAQFVKLADKFRGHIGCAGDDDLQLAAKEGFAIHLDESEKDFTDAGHCDDHGRSDHGQFADSVFGVADGIPGSPFVENRHSAVNQTENVAEGQHAGVAVATELVSRGVEAVE